MRLSIIPRTKQTRALLLSCALTATLSAAPDIFPLRDVRAGQKGIGRTVFAGSKVEEFQVDILGVLQNVGPKQSIILAKLSGGPLAETGVLQGMSGSPVYIDGKLLGAVALGFQGAKNAITGIRPIEEMLRVDPDAKVLLASAPPRASFVNGDLRLEELATPVSFSGFTASAIDHFAPQLRALGLDPRQGVSGSGSPAPAMGDPKKLEPGSMISVQLLSGDMSVSADGTITTIDGNRLYAFGHRFMATGPSEMPFARADVLALLPNITSSFKISQAQEWMGTITEDRDTAISGFTGRSAALTPLDIRVGGNSYHMNVIQDRVMTPLLAQMAVFSAIDSTQRSTGAATYSVRGHADFDSGPVNLDNIYSGDVSVGTVASVGIAQTLSYALSTGFDGLKMKGLTLDITPLETRRQVQIADVSAPRQVRPGEDLDVSVVFSDDNGKDTIRKVRYRVPAGAPAGTMYLTVQDAPSTNLAVIQSAGGVTMHSPQQVLTLLNSLHSNTSAFLRVWRGDNTFTVEGRDIAAPPASVAMILTRALPPGTNTANSRGSTAAEIEIPGGENVVSGSKTIQVEVKE